MTTFQAEIRDIFIYPIKSLPGIRLDEAVVTKYGLAHANNPQICDRYVMRDN
jgi:uncharacterized protein YcbX